VPTADERKGIDTTTFPGDTLIVPVIPAIAPLLARYPLPNDPGGAFGDRTYAPSSKVVTDTNQFSARVDQIINDKATLFGRFSLNQVEGPTTNPDQTAVDPGFAVKFYDYQRNAALRYTQTLSSTLNFSAIGYDRSTPIFPASNHTDPALVFGDGLYIGFNTAHVFSLSVIQDLRFDRISFLQPISHYVTQGWQFLNITSLTSGPPFTVYSGIQQTGTGAGGTDRPDLVSMPDFSTRRTVREDYFGRGEKNSFFFYIPVNLAGGSGPNSGYFGTLGRDTFRGPGFHQFDIALIKNTPFGHRGGGELGILQFREEFFNIFNIVNFVLPSNTVRGSGFGIISKTSGPSRQIQFSLKIVY
jgi:hypothetical protein